MSSEKFRRVVGVKKSACGAAAGRWHAVSVVAQGDCCSAARMLQQSRFLSADAPSLPLPGCPKEQCRCFYKHHADRREQLRRREEITGLRANVRIAKERRFERDRRRTDG